MIYICIYKIIYISLYYTNKTCGMVSRAKAKRGERTHTPQLCNGGTIMYIELVNPSLWRSS